MKGCAEWNTRLMAAAAEGGGEAGQEGLSSTRSMPQQTGTLASAGRRPCRVVMVQICRTLHLLSSFFILFYFTHACGWATPHQSNSGRPPGRWRHARGCSSPWRARATARLRPQRCWRRPSPAPRRPRALQRGWQGWACAGGSMDMVVRVPSGVVLPSWCFRLRQWSGQNRPAPCSMHSQPAHPT